jgi:hypothetical protein
MSATGVAAKRTVPVVSKPVLAVLIGLAAMFGLPTITTISFLDSAVVVGASAAAVWWIAARDRAPRVLDRLSLGALALAALARVVQGPRWQLVVWQLVALIVAVFAGLRMWFG